jgi:HAE1 family hydrophobic/amphiphilic exporter-1
MEKLTRFSVNNPITILMMVFAIVLLGLISLNRLGVDLFPDLNNPKLFVTLEAGERPPEELEKQFTQQIESLAIRQKGVSRVFSISRVGAAMITVEYGWNTDMDEAFLDLQKALSTYNQNTELDELTISQHDPNATPIVTLALSHPQVTNMNDLRQLAENYLRNEIIRLEGIAQVDLLGQEEQQVIIATDRYRLQAHNLTAEQIANRLKESNQNVSGGSIVEMGMEYIIKGMGEFRSLEDIRNLILLRTSPNTHVDAQTVPVYLRDVADIRFENKEPENIVHVNQKRCMALAIYKETRYNTVKAAQELHKALDEIRKSVPGYNLEVIQDQSQFIKSSIDEVKNTALIGIVLAVLVLYIFLRQARVTLVISVAIPISIIATFNLMYFNGLTLNIMTLGGLALGAGMLVDNAIVVMENIYRQLEQGAPLRDAAIQGTAQVGGAITASTLTTIVVFLPIVYLHGAAGELFKDQAWTVAFSLLSSLFVAILVMPMLTRALLKEKSAFAAKSLQFKSYDSALAKLLPKKTIIILGSVILVAATLAIIPRMGSEFIPKSNVNTFSIDMKLPEGTTLERTDETVKTIEAMIHTLLGNDIETIYSRVGNASTSLEGDETIKGDNTATIRLILNPRHQQKSMAMIDHLGLLLKDIPNLETEFIQDQSALQTTLGTEAAPVVVQLYGKDLETLQTWTDSIRLAMQSLSELYNVQTNFEQGWPQVKVEFDRKRIGLFGLSVSAIGDQVQEQLLGRESGQWDNKGELEDITLQLPRPGLNELNDMIIKQGDQEYRLYELADISLDQAPREIHRDNQNRMGQITAHLRNDIPIDRVVQQISAKLDPIELPAGYSFEITGEEQKRRQAFDSLKFALILSIILVYMVMAAQFESLIHPFTILLTIPLAGVGAIWIFVLLGKPLNIMAIIGIIMLAGIAVNDSIILVDAINQLRRQGMERRQAVLAAAKRRIRPIIMTSLTTILALLPLTLGFGQGAALRGPMALAVIGGLVTSTLLTLVVIPCVYLVLDRFSKIA